MRLVRIRDCWLPVKRTTRLRRILASLTVLLTLPLVALGMDLDQQRDFNIPAQDLSTALIQFSKQAGVQIIVADDLTGQKTPGVAGHLSISDALNQLLAAAGLHFRVAGETSLTIGRADASEPAVPRTNTAPKSSLEEVVVAGSRLEEKEGDRILPVRTYSAEAIERSGQTSIAGFLNTLPDVSTAYREDGVKTGFHGVTTVQLHGLPVGTTLTLINGRRVETSFLGFFDLSNIPLSMVERIDVLPVGASAIYGADALAGAIDIVLRKNIDGFELNGNAGHADGVTDSGANAGWGKTWERGSVSLMANYQKHGELLGSQREPTSTTHFPQGAPTSEYLYGDCAPGNVFSLDGSNLPGLSSSHAAIPAGITGRPTIQQLAATAGETNNCNLNRNLALLPESNRVGALLSGHFEVTDSVDTFAEVMFSHANISAALFPGLMVDVPKLYSATLAANNPYNPFGQDVGVSFSYPGSGQLRDGQTESLLRPLLGVRGTWRADWHYEATASLSRDHFESEQPGLDMQQIYNALASSDPATALNPFTTVTPNLAAVLPSISTPDPANTYHANLTNQVAMAQAIVRGPLAQLPAGALQTVFGSEYSQERQDTNAGYEAGSQMYLHRNTYAVFTEGRIPLLAGGAPDKSLERLALTLAGRYDHTSDFGGKPTWQTGLVWRLIESLAFNGSYGVSYKAPQLSEIGGAMSESSAAFLTDPLRNHEPLPASSLLVSGPNTNLKPETGNSLTFGVAYSSRALPGLRASATWFRVNISNYIALHSYIDLLADPNLFPGAVVREPPTAQDQAQGLPGVVSRINDIYYNFGALSVSGVDADASYAIPTGLGDITPSVSLTNTDRYRSAISPGAPSIDTVSQASTAPGWAPRWKGTTALAWKWRALSASADGRYVSRYRDYTNYAVNTNVLGNFWVFDLNTRYDFDPTSSVLGTSLKGAFVSIGVVDLLNKTPPYSFNGQGYDSTEYDIRGRYVFANVGVRF